MMSNAPDKPVKEHSVWTFRQATPSLRLPPGTTGVVVHIHGDEHAFEVELFDEAGKTIGVETIHASELTLFAVECEREEDGRYVAEIPALPGVMSYGSSPEEAKSKANQLAMRVFADEVRASQDFMSNYEDLPIQERDSLKTKRRNPRWSSS
jgi:predicted RNase H-like HicB family nuclease